MLQKCRMLANLLKSKETMALYRGVGGGDETLSNSQVKIFQVALFTLSFIPLDGQRH